MSKVASKNITNTIPECRERNKLIYTFSLVQYSRSFAFLYRQFNNLQLEGNFPPLQALFKLVKLPEIHVTFLLTTGYCTLIQKRVARCLSISSPQNTFTHNLRKRFIDSVWRIIVRTFWDTYILVHNCYILRQR
jgi:hypothetical protein